ncbi:MAG: phosphate ABC transporter permease PstA [Alphaproteobacteria bacterium]|nr:phosphate ABC transporter permease PstA [Alphaproteobacteria bacterium]
MNYVERDATRSLAEALPHSRGRVTDIAARGEPYTWALGGALALGIVMIVGFLALVLYNGATTFIPKPITVVTLADGAVVAGEPFRSESYRPGPAVLEKLAPEVRARIAANDGYAGRTLYRIGNYDIYNEDFRWVSDFEVARMGHPTDLIYAERLEWGPFIGRLKSVHVGGAVREAASMPETELARLHGEARARWQRLRGIERSEIGAVNHQIERERLAVRKAEIAHGAGSAEARQRAAEAAIRIAELQREYDRLAAEARRLREQDRAVRVTLAAIGGEEKELALSALVRFYPANAISLTGKAGIYLSRWWEFLSDEPREANTEGGVMPAIFGTFAMTLLLVIAVTPFGVITALYLREYARQGRLVSVIRISVNNLAGVPSIVYGVFGLGFFAYVLGGSIDQLFYPERLPNPTFGTGGLLWASLTLALLTVPVVIVATEEALAAVPRSMREGSLACGASKWQTIRNIVLPRAMPGIMTGIILAMARGAGEVAPLMLVGVVKLAPELPVDGFFPFVHLERSFMHLGFHIFDVGFQSRNSEAGKPMVFVTTVLLVGLIFLMNISAIAIRNRLKRKFAGSQF